MTRNASEETGGVLVDTVRALGLRPRGKDRRARIWRRSIAGAQVTWRQLIVGAQVTTKSVLVHPAPQQKLVRNAG